jgi:hypothetical protein
MTARDHDEAANRTRLGIASLQRYRWFELRFVERISRATLYPTSCAWLGWWLLSTALLAQQTKAPTANPIASELSGVAVIRGVVDGEEAVLTTTSRLAGAVHSIRWKGQEFIDSADHGRQLQSALSLDAMNDQPFWAECFNPTEAGSRLDGAGERSTSRLLGLKASERELMTSTQMAFWLAPGERSDGRLALNRESLSGFLLHKRIRWNAYENDHILEFSNTFEFPENESHRFAQFEVVTGYMPAEFDTFWGFDAQSQSLQRLDDGPGEQPLPVVLATADSRFAMGAVLVAGPDSMSGRPGYGRFRFREEGVVKWNIAQRYRESSAMTERRFSFRSLIAIGSLEEVRQAMVEIHSGELRPKDAPSRP